MTTTVTTAVTTAMTTIMTTTAAGDTFTLAVDPRLTGPRGHANGGFAAGLVAELVGGTAEVRLDRPVPLDTDLTVVSDGAVATVSAGRRVVASGRRVAPFTVSPPVRPGYADALRAAEAHPFRGVRHLLSDCVVCGPERTDGLGVVWGPLAGQDGVLAAPFAPTHRDATLGVVHPAAVWGALDCPGFPSALIARRRIALLGTLAVHRRRDVRVGERLVVVGWSVESRGRVHRTCSALLDAGGDVVASGRATWVELRHQRLARVTRRLF